MHREPFTEGERVERMKYDTATGRLGTIVEVYHGTRNTLGEQIKFYAVQWDDTQLTERGYTEIGLRKVTQ